MLRAVLIAVALTAACIGPAGAQVFHDDFDGSSLDPTKWHIDGAGTISVSGGTATLSSGCGEVFPYVTSVSNPFPTSGDFILRVGFSYPEPNSGGNGFGATTGFTLGGPGTGFWVWQDLCCGGLRASCGDIVVPIGLAGDTSYHVYEWRYLSGVYSLFVDDHFLAIDQSNFRPVGFFFGHPLSSFCPWSTQAIDFVDIRAIGVTPTERSTWSRIKAIYR